VDYTPVPTAEKTCRGDIQRWHGQRQRIGGCVRWSESWAELNTYINRVRQFWP